MVTESFDNKILIQSYIFYFQPFNQTELIQRNKKTKGDCVRKLKKFNFHFFYLQSPSFFY